MTFKSRRILSVALCVALSLVLLGASSVARADSNASPSSSPSSSSTSSTSSSKCACSDVRPRSGGIDFELGPTCSEIQAKGNCNEGYMQKTIAEMKGAPYCQISCGKCPCCQPLAEKLKTLGLGPLADALAAADPTLAAALKNPATEVTLLAPLKPAAGFKGGSLDADTARRHILPVMNGTGALWTRELLLGAAAGQVDSAEKGAPVLIKGATLSSGGGAGGKPATIVESQSNIEACKSLIHVLDGVL